MLIKNPTDILALVYIIDYLIRTFTKKQRVTNSPELLPAQSNQRARDRNIG